MKYNFHNVILLAWLLSATLANANADEQRFSSTTPAANAPLTQEMAVQIALSESPRFKAAVAQVDAASGRAWQLGRWANPELEFKIEEWPVSHGGSFSDSKQSVGISQQLPWPGKKSADRKSGQAGVQLSEAQVTMRKTELIRDVKAAFSAVLAAEASVEAGEELLRIARASADAARKRVESGATSYQEQLRAEIQLEQAQSEVADLRLAAAATRQRLFTLLGRPDLVQVNLVGALADSCHSALLDASPDDWQQRHPSHAAAATALRRTQLDLRRARLEPYPDVTAKIAGGRLGESDQAIVEFGISFPLPILDTAKGHKAAAAAEVRIAQAELEAVRQALHREWTNAVQRCRVAGEQVASFRDRILPKAAQAMRLVQTGFDEGRFGFIDLLDTQRTFAETQLAYQRKLLELNIAQAELEALVRPSFATEFNLKQN